MVHHEPRNDRVRGVEKTSVRKPDNPRADQNWMVDVGYKNDIQELGDTGGPYENKTRGTEDENMSKTGIYIEKD